MKLKLMSLLLVVSSIIFIPSAHATDLKGSGSTFAANFMDKCRVAYSATGNTITYSPVGSGAGKNQFAFGITDFTVSDVPYSSVEQKPKKEFVYVPIVAGAIAITYNLKGYKGTIKLSKENLSKIFAGQITKWNDPLLRKDNPLRLPNKNITVIYRVDGSGTSEVFTTYLNYIAKDIWTKPGNKTFSSAFPGNVNNYIGRFISASGSQSIKMLQDRTDGSISYNEMSYSKGLGISYVENGAGRFIKPTANAASRFLAEFTANPDGTITPDYDNKNKLAYNISTFSYGITAVGSKDVAKFFTFALTKCKAAEFGYSRVTGKALALARLQISKI